MGEFSTLLQQGNGWFFIPSAILLGILHGLEPGHSKTMMAAFIIAIKGTVKQAVMLGLAATLSHTAIVWLIALGGMYLSRAFTAQSVEPWAAVNFCDHYSEHRVLDVLADMARRAAVAGGKPPSRP